MIEVTREEETAMTDETDRNRTSVLGRLLGVTAVIAVLAAVSACKTTEGAGEDIENLGENIQDAAED
jgi:predicted small secreted protein